MITVAYMTCRNNPRFGWFIQSLKNQYHSEIPVEIIVVDGSPYFEKQPEYEDKIEGFNITLLKPKPTAWQGKYKTTSVDYFAAANARNTAIIHAKGDYIVFVDDLSVLTPGWWERVLKAYKERYIVLGAYKKVRDLVVEDGVIKQYQETPAGNDSRLHMGSHWATGGLLYGASFGAPIECLLDVNGLDEICDGMGYEDTHLGYRLQKMGHRMFYDTQMMTFEDELAHQEGAPFLRVDKLLTKEQYEEARNRMGANVYYELGGRTDVSHLLMDLLYSKGDKAHWTRGNNFNIRELREKKEFPTPTGEEVYWADLTPLKEW